MDARPKASSQFGVATVIVVMRCIAMKEFLNRDAN